MLPALVRVLRLRDAAYEVFLSVGAVAYAAFFGPISLLLAIQIVGIMALFAVFSFTSNNFFDREVDKENPLKLTKNPYAMGELGTKTIIVLNCVLAGACLFLTWLWIPTVLVVFLALLVNVVLYSRFFKRYPFVDIVSHAFWVLTFVLVPIWGLSRGDWAGAAFGILGGSTLGELDNQFRDSTEDYKAGIRTTVVAFPRMAAVLSWISSGFVLLFITWFALEVNLVSLVLVPLVIVHRIQQARPFPAYDRLFLGLSIGVLVLVALSLLVG